MRLSASMPADLSALVEQLDKVVDAWSVPRSAQNVLRQMAALLVHMTSAA